MPLVSEIDRIVKMAFMPEEIAIGLLSSAILHATGQCDLSAFADAVANWRAMLPEECPDAHGLLCGFLDEADKSLSPAK